MGNYSNEIVDNIKNEPEEDFVLFLPFEDPQSQANANSYQCVNCNQKFATNKLRRKHALKEHFKDLRWHCSKCNYSAILESNLKNHIESHLKRFSCPSCDFKTGRSESLRNHQKRHRHGTNAELPSVKFECNECMKSYLTENGLRIHKRDFHGQGNFQCDNCEKTFKSKRKVSVHVKTHGKVSCKICSQLVGLNYLKFHEQSHSTSVKHECKTCDKSYKSSDSLRNHNKSVHKVAINECHLCDKTFINPPALKRHVLTHQAKLTCKFCNKLITRKHMRDHVQAKHPSGELIPSCKIAQCRQTFLNVQELDEHQRIHIGPQCYKCPTCSREIKVWKDMLKHIKFH